MGIATAFADTYLRLKDQKAREQARRDALIRQVVDDELEGDRLKQQMQMHKEKLQQDQTQFEEGLRLDREKLTRLEEKDAAGEVLARDRESRLDQATRLNTILRAKNTAIQQGIDPDAYARSIVPDYVSGEEGQTPTVPGGAFVPSRLQPQGIVGALSQLPQLGNVGQSPLVGANIDLKKAQTEKAKADAALSRQKGEFAQRILESDLKKADLENDLKELETKRKEMDLKYARKDKEYEQWLEGEKLKIDKARLSIEKAKQRAADEGRTPEDRAAARQLLNDRRDHFTGQMKNLQEQLYKEDARIGNARAAKVLAQQQANAHQAILTGSAGGNPLVRPNDVAYLESQVEVHKHNAIVMAKTVEEDEAKKRKAEILRELQGYKQLVHDSLTPIKPSGIPLNLQKQLAESEKRNRAAAGRRPLSPNKVKKSDPLGIR